MQEKGSDTLHCHAKHYFDVHFFLTIFNCINHRIMSSWMLHSNLLRHLLQNRWCPLTPINLLTLFTSHPLNTRYSSNNSSFLLYLFLALWRRRSIQSSYFCNKLTSQSRIKAVTEVGHRNFIRPFHITFIGMKVYVFMLGLVKGRVLCLGPIYAD